MLLYTCVANLAKEYLKAGKELPEPIHHYYTEADPDATYRDKRGNRIVDMWQM